MPSQAGLVESDEDTFFANVTPKSWDDVKPLDLSGMPTFSSGTAWGDVVLGGAFPDLVYHPIFLPRLPEPVWISCCCFYSTLSSLCAMMCESFELPPPAAPQASGTQMLTTAQPRHI
ncbi:hypothetical protein J4G07_22305 [Candidatus Poribacteria bacterium]|nr:hypothetical protein [Candidatus Poribacteria bacterium]